jgi:hypothetical protein
MRSVPNFQVLCGACPLADVEVAWRKLEGNGPFELHYTNSLSALMAHAAYYTASGRLLVGNVVMLCDSGDCLVKICQMNTKIIPTAVMSRKIVGPTGQSLAFSAAGVVCRERAPTKFSGCSFAFISEITPLRI